MIPFCPSIELSDSELGELLERAASAINTTEFIADDPVQFPRRFSTLQDIEITSLLSATIAWGNRRMICNDCHKMLALMDNTPYRYVMEEGYEELPEDANIHRTFFNRNLQYYLRGLRGIYLRHESLADYACTKHIADSGAPAWSLVEHLNGELMRANGGATDSRCLPQNLRTTALKRINMALRWLVRDDGIVDLGVWKGVMKPSQLRIPLDVHVGNVARNLGLLTRRSDDRLAVEQLTDRLRRYRPDDPVLYDFALFGIGVAGLNPTAI